MSAAPPAIRPATADDVAGIRSILAEHGNDGPHPVHDIVGPYVGHLVAAGRTLVIDDGDGLAAFAATIGTGRGVHLTDFFVRKDRLGGGLGRPLLEAVFGDDWPRTTFASDDPRAMPLYIRVGLTPLWPSLYLLGAAASLPDVDAGLVAEAADPTWIDALEHEWNGRSRPADHAFWGRQAEADPFVVMDEGDIVAAGYGRARQIGPERAVDRLLIRPDHDPVGPIVAALRRVARGGTVLACLPGPNLAVRPLLESGFRIQDRDTYMASEPDLVDPTRFLPNPGML